VVDDSPPVVLESTTDTSYWASAARNSPTVGCFAVATTQGILLVEQNPDTWVQNRHADFKSSDTLAVDWLDQNVVISGARNGQIRLWDIRNNGTSTRMLHPSCTTHVRRLNEHMIVVAGLMHQVTSPPPSDLKSVPQLRHSFNSRLASPVKIKLTMVESQIVEHSEILPP